MPRFGKWVLTLGLMAATPVAAVAAGPFGNVFKGSRTAQKRTNQQVAEDIATALRSARLNRFELDVEFSNGVCTLIGKVGTLQQKADATRVVLKIAGVTRVDNRLTPMAAKAPARRAPARRALVKAPAKAPSRVRRAAYIPRKNAGSGIQLTGTTSAVRGNSNQQMAESIAKSLKSAGLTGYEMEITYQNGLVILAGSVSSPRQWAQAGQIASQVPGVDKVSNQLRVGRPQRQPIRPVSYQNGAPGYRNGSYAPVSYQNGGAPGAPGAPSAYMHPGPGARHTVYNSPNLPSYSVPTYASYPNSATYNYPKQYSASAWPYIGPFYPYPQVPMGWRSATLEWDDGYWGLKFSSRTNRWWWFLNPKNW